MEYKVNIYTKTGHVECLHTYEHAYETAKRISDDNHIAEIVMTNAQGEIGTEIVRCKHTATSAYLQL